MDKGHSIKSLNIHQPLGQIIQSMNNKETATQCYKHFSKKEGNQHIAGQFALEKILDIIDVNKPNRILEVGLGIGSISYTILSIKDRFNPNLTYHGTEANDFCLNALKQNLSDFSDSIEIYKNLEALNSTIKYDFVIIDGSDESIEQIKDIISPNGVIFIEGGRANQTEKMKSTFPRHKYTACISDYRNPSYGPFSSSIWSGGGQLIYIDPTSKQLLHFLKERLKTSYRYRIGRKLHPGLA